MCAATCTSTIRAPHTHRFLINYSAIRNDCKFNKNNALALPNRLKLACSCAVSLPRKPSVTIHKSLLSRSHSFSRAFLFDTNERTRKNLTCSQQTRKQFLFRTFERLLLVLFNTFERSSIYPFLPPTRHGRIASL
jgi:hypothetical protein